LTTIFIGGLYTLLNARHPDVLLMTIKTYKYLQNTTDLL